MSTTTSTRGPFPTISLASCPRGQGQPVPVTTPCEPLGDGTLWAITPELGTRYDDEGDIVQCLTGQFTITHVPTGLSLFDRHGGCVDCCRRAGVRLLALGADWSTFRPESSGHWLKTLSAVQYEELASIRALGLRCATETCGQ